MVTITFFKLWDEVLFPLLSFIILQVFWNVVYNGNNVLSLLSVELNEVMIMKCFSIVFFPLHKPIASLWPCLESERMELGVFPSL